MIEITNEDNMQLMARYPDKKKPYILSAEQRARKSELARMRYNDPNSTAKQKQKDYRKKNIKEYNEYRNNYRTKNARGIYDVTVQGAKKRGLSVSFSRDDFEIWYNGQSRSCIYCQRSEDQVLKSDPIMQTKCNRLTIDRLDNNIGYRIDNMGLSCKRCNTIKGNFFSQSEMIEIGKIIKSKTS